MSHELQRAAIDREFAGEPLDAETAAHVETCAECKAYREKLLHVDAVLAKGALGPGRQDALEARLFAKLGVAPPEAVKPAVPARRPFFALAGLVAAIAAVVLLVQWRAPADDAFTPRGSKDAAFGVRAFCVDDGKVVAEARENGILACGAGEAVQLSYTASRAAELSISFDGDDVVLPKTAVTAGVDVPLSFSTPVGEWLARPRVVKWSFTSGAEQHAGSLTITP
jgi:anti-sigma factor RsiW